MKRFLFILALTSGLLMPSMVNAASFKDCSAMKKQYPNGIAQSAAAAKKQKSAPKVSASLYKRYVKLDVDKDGTACEKVAAPNGDNPLGGNAPEDFLMPNVVCMNLQAAQDEIQKYGVFFSRSDDATGMNRSQILDRNWIVVKQTPLPGQPVTELEAVLSAVKIGESTGGIC